MTTPEVTNLDCRYRRLRDLGGGGFGDVYLAHDEVLDRDVALKLLKNRYAKDKQFVERFERRAKSSARLNHPNIVRVYDAGEDIFEGQTVPYITMEHVSKVRPNTEKEKHRGY